MRISVKSSRFGDDTAQSHVRNAAVQNVCFWHKADITRLSPNVRFRGQSGHKGGPPGRNERRNSLSENVIFFSYPM
jgi:hypothetical protein